MKTLTKSLSIFAFIFTTCLMGMNEARALQYHVKVIAIDPVHAATAYFLPPEDNRGMVIVEFFRTTNVRQNYPFPNNEGVTTIFDKPGLTAPTVQLFVDWSWPGANPHSPFGSGSITIEDQTQQTLTIDGTVRDVDYRLTLVVTQTKTISAASTDITYTITSATLKKI